MDLARKRLFLLDLDGTVYLEETLLPGAAAFLSCVRANGGAVRYLTNNSSRGVDAGLEKMHRLGVPAEREEFLTAVEATVYYLKPAAPPRMSITPWARHPFAASCGRRDLTSGKCRTRT